MSERRHSFDGGKVLLLLRRKLKTNLTSNGASNVILERKNIAQIAIVGLGPEVLLIGKSNELSRNANAVSGMQDGAFDDGINAKFAGDLRERLLRALVLHDGGAGNDTQSGKLGESGDQFVGHAFGEVLLFRIARQVFERKNGNRSDIRNSGNRTKSLAKSSGGEGKHNTEKEGERRVNEEVPRTRSRVGLGSSGERARDSGGVAIALEAAQVGAELGG